MVCFEDKVMCPKVHWMILDDSGRFLARIPRWFGLKSTISQGVRQWLSRKD